MTINSAFSVNGVVPTGAVAVAPGSVVTLRVLNLAGLNTIEWAIVGNDSHVRVNPTITRSGSPNGAVATFTMPADIGDTLGQAYRIQCVGKSGGRSLRAPGTVSSITSYAIVGAVNRSGLVPFAYGEELDRDLTYGWTETINKSLSNISTPAWGAMYSTAERSIEAVATAPGWYVVGGFVMPVTADVKLDVLGCVSDASLTLSARLYCVTTGAVGVVTGSLVTLTSLIDARVLSATCSLIAARIYQVQAQVVGNSGADYFGSVRRATPALP